jgi:hypothetical protein
MSTQGPCPGTLIENTFVSCYGDPELSSCNAYVNSLANEYPPVSTVIFCKPPDYRTNWMTFYGPCFLNEAECGPGYHYWITEYYCQGC